jgi:hypothetical protein
VPTTIAASERLEVPTTVPTTALTTVAPAAPLAGRVVVIDPGHNGGNGANDSFSSNFLGWQPIVSSVSRADSSNPGSNSGSAPRVTPGPVVEPSATNGLGSPKVLASTTGGRGAGTAKLDARLKLYIPASVSDGRFTATLTFTVI